MRAGAKVVKRDGEEAVRKRISRILRGRMDRWAAPQVALVAFLLGAGLIICQVWFAISSSGRKSAHRHHRCAETGPAQSTQSVDRPARQKSARADRTAAKIRIQNQAAQPNNAPHRWNQRTRSSVRAQQRSREPPRTTNSQQTWLITTLWRRPRSARASKPP